MGCTNVTFQIFVDSNVQHVFECNKEGRDDQMRITFMPSGEKTQNSNKEKQLPAKTLALVAQKQMLCFFQCKTVKLTWLVLG